MKKKSPDEILFEKIRNYCLAPWISTRKELPEYGVPVLMAWHHDRTEPVPDIKGFEGYSFGVGARYKLTTTIDEAGNVLISSHFGVGLPAAQFRMFEDCYRTGINNDTYYYSHSYNSQIDSDDRRYGLDDPYLKKKTETEKEKKEETYDYWINYAAGKFGSNFANIHSADMSFIPESTVDAILGENQNHKYRMNQVLNNFESYLSRYPDYWMKIPALK